MISASKQQKCRGWGLCSLTHLNASDISAAEPPTHSSPAGSMGQPRGIAMMLHLNQGQHEVGFWEIGICAMTVLCVSSTVTCHCCSLLCTLLPCCKPPCCSCSEWALIAVQTFRRWYTDEVYEELSSSVAISGFPWGAEFRKRQALQKQEWKVHVSRTGICFLGAIMREMLWEALCKQGSIQREVRGERAQAVCFLFEPDVKDVHFVAQDYLQ